MYNSSSTDQSTDLTLSLLPLGFAADFEIGVEILAIRYPAAIELAIQTHTRSK